MKHYYKFTLINGNSIQIKGDYITYNETNIVIYIKKEVIFYIKRNALAYIEISNASW